MGAVFQLIRDVLAPAPGVRKISAAEAGEALAAGEALDAAGRRAAEIVREAEAMYAQCRKQGYADGLEAGRQAHMEKMLETVLSSVDFIERLEGDLVDVVNEAVRKLVGELPPEERIVRIIRTALAVLRDQRRVTVRVAPEDEAVVRDSFAALLAAGGKGAFLGLVPDGRLERGSCQMESELGVVDAGLETQLTALRRALSAKIRPE